MLKVVVDWLVLRRFRDCMVLVGGRSISETNEHTGTDGAQLDAEPGFAKARGLDHGEHLGIVLASLLGHGVSVVAKRGRVLKRGGMHGTQR